MTRRLSSSCVRTVRLLVLAAVVITFAAKTSLGENSFDRGTPAESKGGLAGLSTYAQDKIETVNLANGNLSIQIPLVTLGGRGENAFTVTLSYNGKLWAGQHEAESNPDGGGGMIHHWASVYNDLVASHPNLILLGGGWSISKGPAIKTKIVTIVPNTAAACQGTGATQFILTRYWLVLPDGSEIELRDDLTDGRPHPRAVSGVCPLGPDQDRGRVWHSADGSAITYVKDISTSLDGWVFLADGTRLRMVALPFNGGAKCTKIVDRNGNEIRIQYDKVFDANVTGAVTYTDQLGRRVAVQGGIDGATVTIEGNGTDPANRFYTVTTGYIASSSNSIPALNLRADYQNTTLYPRPLVSGDYSRTFHGGEDPHGYYGTSPHTDLFPGSDLNFMIAMDQTKAVTQLTLLDGRSFRFRYSPWGEVAEIVYPGGGVSEIDYQAFGSPLELCDGGPLLSQMNRRVTARRVKNDGVTTDVVWTYARGQGVINSTTYPFVNVEVRKPGSPDTLLMGEKHWFLALDADYRQCIALSGSDGTGYEKWENGKEFRVERQTGGGTQVDKRTWEQRAQVNWGASSPYVQQRGQEYIPNDDRMTREDMILENGRMKRANYTYDRFNNVTNVKEYDFGPINGSQGSLLRETVRTYPTDLLLNTYCYTNLNGLGSCSTAVSTASDWADRVIHMRRLVLTEEVKNGQASREAYSEYEYDNYTPDAGQDHAAVQVNTGMIRYEGGRFGLFNAQKQPRGNATRVRGWISGLSPSETYAITHNHYDEAGNVWRAKDARGYFTTISYTDNFGNGNNPDSGSQGPNGATFALPTLVTNPKSHVVKTQYNYIRGLATGVKDPNGVITKTEYDAYDRPIRVTAAKGVTTGEEAVTEMSYPTASANESKVSSQLDATRYLTSRTTFDGFGRPAIVSQAENGFHYSNASVSYTIHTQTIYDGLGRARFVTNPYRSSTASTDGWTRTAYDLAGRVAEVATFTGPPATLPPATGTDSAWTGSVVTAYASEVTTVRDQDNRQRSSAVDGLGRLIRVEELQPWPSADIYATTTYGYDGRGNLKTVTQGSQTRSFTYDGLSRLKSATNPEQGTTPTNGTTTYEYDANSNLTSKTDPRAVTITYGYDELNRVTSRDYSNTPTTNPDVSYAYDTATYGVGRLRSVTQAGVVTYNYTAYDALGRAKTYNQDMPGIGVYNVSAYNKAGLMVSQTYPSNKVVQSEYDGAGRLAGVKQGTSFYAGAAATDATNRLQYTAHGAVRVMKLGNNLWEHAAFNSRLQPEEIGLGTSGTDSSKLKVELVYTNPDQQNNNGNLRYQRIYLPGQAEALNQAYLYDAVNRLSYVQEAVGAPVKWKQGYSYDVYGNRWVSVYEGVGLGLLTPRAQTDVSAATNRVAMADFAYDAAGNVTADASNAAMVYDAENRLVSYTRYNKTTQYAYDGDGRRVKRVASDNVTTVFVYDAAGMLVAEYDNAGPGQAVDGAGGTKYLTSDHLGSVRVVTDSGGAVKSRHDYLPFGEEIDASFSSRAAVAGYAGSDATRQRFTSKERDGESGLDYFGARYYSGAQGRFTSCDPLGASMKAEDPQTMNRYTFVLNNPLRYVDPDGLDVADNDYWSRLNEYEQSRFSWYLTRGQKFETKEERLKAAGEKFNKLIQADQDGKAPTDAQMAERFVTALNFHDKVLTNDRISGEIKEITGFFNGGNG